MQIWTTSCRHSRGRTPEQHGRHSEVTSGPLGPRKDYIFISGHPLETGVVPGWRRASDMHQRNDNVHLRHTRQRADRYDTQ